MTKLDAVTEKERDEHRPLYEARPVCVSPKQLASLLGVGRNTADKVGREAGARIQIGGRVVYRLDTVEAYLDTLQGS